MCAKQKNKGKSKKKKGKKPRKVRDYWNEQWVKVPTKAPTKRRYYEFSNYGRIRSVSKFTGDEQLLNGTINSQNYITLNLHLKGGKRENIYVHKLVAEEFVAKETDDQKFVVHLDYDLHNNFFKNLKWMTQEELTQFRIDKGAYKPGNPNRLKHYKLSTAKVKLIKKRLLSGKVKKKTIAKQFGISMENLRKIDKGIYWAHVTLDEDDLKDLNDEEE